MADEFDIRPLADGDRAFVVTAWLESFAQSHDAGPLPMHLYRDTYRKAIAWLLERGDTQTVVACLPTDPNQVLGFACGGKTHHGVLLHYAFVKSWFRRRGVASALICAAGLSPAAPYVYTYCTPTWRTVVEASRTWRLGRRLPLAARYRTEEPKNALHPEIAVRP